jgi:hypothetical protein
LGINLPVGLSLLGDLNVANLVTAKARADVGNIYSDAMSRTTLLTQLDGDITGDVLVPGTYVSSDLALHGTVTLDAKGDPNATFIIKVNGNLSVAPDSVVKLVNKANSDHVIWVVSGTASIGARASFIGRLVSLGDITAGAHANIRGSLLSRDGIVCLDTNVISTPAVLGATVNVGNPLAPSEITPTTGGSGDGTGTGDNGDGTTTGDGLTDPTDTTSQTDGAHVLGADVTQTPTNASGVLAFTGRNIETIGVAAALLSALGGAAYWFARRRRQEIGGSLP